MQYNEYSLLRTISIQLTWCFSACAGLRPINTYNVLNRFMTLRCTTWRTFRLSAASDKNFALFIFFSVEIELVKDSCLAMALKCSQDWVRSECSFSRRLSVSFQSICVCVCVGVCVGGGGYSQLSVFYRLCTLSTAQVRMSI